MDPGWKVTTKPHDECGFPDPSKTDWNHPEKRVRTLLLVHGWLARHRARSPPQAFHGSASRSAAQNTTHRPGICSQRSPSPIQASVAFAISCPAARAISCSAAFVDSFAKSPTTVGGRRLQTARRRSRTRTPPSQQGSRSNPALDTMSGSLFASVAPDANEQIMWAVLRALRRWKDHRRIR